MLNRLKNLVFPRKPPASGSVRPSKPLLSHPDHAQECVAYKEQGDAHVRKGHLEQAIGCYQRAIALDQNYAGAYSNLAIALLSLGRLAEAEANYRRLLQIDPDDADAHNNLGVSLQHMGRLAEAEASYRRAIQICPEHNNAHNNLGAALLKSGRLTEAEACCQRALQINPDNADAHNNLGHIFKEQGRPSEAEASFRRALQINPNHADTHNNLGNSLKDMGRLAEAESSYRQALGINPSFAKAHCNLGNVLRDMGRLAEAESSYRRALGIDPAFAKAYSNLLFLYSYQALLDPRKYLVQARKWEHACLPRQDRQAARDRIFQHAPLTGRRLKVGYVSGDFRQHAVSYFIEQLFTHHDRKRVELFAYSNGVLQDAVTVRLHALAEHWVHITGVNDTVVRDRIEADGIDVLIDLSGHTSGNRLGVFARRAAPVQANYLGYFASTGLSEMDYWIGDSIVTPPETDSHFSEQVWRLPRVWVSYKTIADAPDPEWCPATDGSVWIGSFNSLGKLTPKTLALWAKVLHALPEGRLLLKTHGLADATNRQRILDDMLSHGIPADRIVLQRDTNWMDYMAQYNRLDIALDPVDAHSGGTITCDALWMGVPVIHALGSCTTSRFTASMLDAIGHPEWIARSETEYVEKVVALARDIEQRKALRSSQRNMMARSPLCDAKDLARNLEDAYIEMFTRRFK